MQPPTIEVSSDYRKFKLMKGNRGIDYNHVKRMKREMEVNPHLFAVNPIQVNENLFVIDGQHRLKAAIELKYPIYYVVLPGSTLTDTRSLNVTQRHWQLRDFANSYAEGGNKDYQEFLGAVGKYPLIAPAIIMKVLAGAQLHRISEDFRRGEFKIDDLDTSIDQLDKLQAIIEKTRTRLNTGMAMALIMMLKGENKGDEDFEYTKFMAKLNRKGCIDLFKIHSKMQDNIRSIEDVYNFHNAVRVRLY